MVSTGFGWRGSWRARGFSISQKKNYLDAVKKFLVEGGTRDRREEAVGGQISRAVRLDLDSGRFVREPGVLPMWN